MADDRLPPDADELDAVTICRVLVRHGVEFVVIGGVAAILHGAPTVTLDLDVVPDDRAENRDRVAAALQELRATLRYGQVRERIHRFSNGEWLTGARTWTFSTPSGDFDVLFAPAGTSGYEGLARSAVPVTIANGLTVLTASLDDLIRMKEAANRPKDQFALPILRWLRDREAGGEGP